MSLSDKTFERLLENAKENKERLFYLRDKIIDQIKDLTNKESKTEFFLLITTALYFLINSEVVADIHIGPLQIINSEFALIFIPPIFSFILVRLLFLYNIKKIQKENLTKVLNKIEPNCEVNSELSFLLPFEISFITNLIDFNKGRFLGIILLITIIPVLFGLIFFFFGIQFFWLYELFINWNQNWSYKISAISTVWLMVFEIVIFMLLVISGENKSEELK